MVMLVISFLIASVFVLSLLFYKFIFLRDPERKIPAGSSIVSPADGKVINIVKINKSLKSKISNSYESSIRNNLKIRKGFGKVDVLCSDVIRQGYLISIFMSVFNVHVNRAPIDGTIMSIKYKKGKFFMASDIEKSFFNESNEIIMKTDIGKIKIIQIAGFLARRIQCFVRGKQKVNKGQRIGRIIIGSQVTLILPKNIRLSVKKDDKVKAGETVIAEYQNGQKKI